MIDAGNPNTQVTIDYCEHEGCDAKESDSDKITECPNCGRFLCLKHYDVDSGMCKVCHNCAGCSYSRGKS